jgi:hypothetical protein
MKTEWFCEKCQRAGTVAIPKQAGIFDAIARLKRAHDQFQNPCRDPLIRVRNPQHLTRIEWRKQVSEWRKVA